MTAAMTQVTSSWGEMVRGRGMGAIEMTDMWAIRRAPQAQAASAPCRALPCPAAWADVRVVELHTAPHGEPEASGGTAVTKVANVRADSR